MNDAKQMANLPMRIGGLGLRSAVRCAGAAYWASWADALHMISERNPAVADTVVESLADLRMATNRLDREVFWRRPSWANLRAGHRPPDIDQVEPGEWRHGWQYWSSSASDSHHRKLTTLLGRTAARRAHIAGALREERRSCVDTLPNKSWIHDPAPSVPETLAGKDLPATSVDGGVL